MWHAPADQKLPYTVVPELQRAAHSGANQVPFPSATRAACAQGSGKGAGKGKRVSGGVPPLRRRSADPAELQAEQVRPLSPNLHPAPALEPSSFAVWVLHAFYLACERVSQRVAGAKSDFILTSTRELLPASWAH